MKEQWLKVNYYSEENKIKISRIIEIEWEITNAVQNGHRCHLGDIFKDKRNEMNKLRKELTGTYNSPQY
mgnify:CR=1 FL=1